MEFAHGFIYGLCTLMAFALLWRFLEDGITLFKYTNEIEVYDFSTRRIKIIIFNITVFDYIKDLK